MSVSYRPVNIMCVIRTVSGCNQYMHVQDAVGSSSYEYTCVHSGHGKVIMDLGLEVSVMFIRPATVGERVELLLNICDPVTSEFTFTEIPPAKAAADVSEIAGSVLESLEDNGHVATVAHSSNAATGAIEAAAFMATVPLGSGGLSDARLLP